MSSAGTIRQNLFSLNMQTNVFQFLFAAKETLQKEVIKSMVTTILMTNSLLMNVMLKW